MSRRRLLTGSLLGLTGFGLHLLLGCNDDDAEREGTQDDDAPRLIPDPGAYEVLLWLPDQAERIRRRPEYAVRLANIGTWEPATGYNRLGHTVVIGEARSGASSYTYAADLEPIHNPERGPFHPWHTGSSGYQFIDPAIANTVREQEGTNFVRWNVNIRQFRDTDAISESYLDNLQVDFDTLRDNGFKVNIRAQYDSEGDPLNDVPFDRMARHIEQLASLFNGNKDIISAYEAGFIGKWGEWHGSTHYGSGWWPESNWTALPEVLQKVLDEFEDRPVMLRYPRHIRYMINEGGTPRISPGHLSRLGFHNDSFLAAPDEWGTYGDHLQPDDRPFMLEWLPGRCVSGEHEWDPNYGDEWRQERFDYFAAQHWSSLRFDFNTNVTGMWKSTDHPTEEGTYWDLIRRQLGYRLCLTGALLPNSMPLGAPIPMEISLKNVGWAAPYNARDVVVVLRNSMTRQEHYLPVQADVRTWTTEAGEIRLRTILFPRDRDHPERSTGA